MRNLLIIAMLLMGAFMAGWFKVNRDGERTTIEINRSEIRQDTRKAIDRGRELLEKHELQGSVMTQAQEQASQLWNQLPQASQAGYWTGGGQAAGGQNNYQSYAAPQYIGEQPPASQPWQKVAPTSSWQYQPSGQPPANPYQQPYSR